MAGARGGNVCAHVAAACIAILVHDGVANRTKVRTAYSLTPQRLLRHASYCHYGQETSLAGSQFFSSGKSDVLRCISSAREHTYCPTCLEPVPASVSGVTHSSQTRDGPSLSTQRARSASFVVQKLDLCTLTEEIVICNSNSVLLLASHIKPSTPG